MIDKGMLRDVVVLTDPIMEAVWGLLYCGSNMTQYCCRITAGYVTRHHHLKNGQRLVAQVSRAGR